MNPRARFILCLSIIVSLTAITNQAVAQSTPEIKSDSMNMVRAIVISNEIFKAALSHSDSVAVANCYAEDAQMLSEGNPSTVGRAAIRHFYTQMIRGGVTGFSYVTTGVWGSSNNLIVEDGTLTFSLTTGKVVAKGRYLLVWKRVNGRLKIFRDTFFSDK